MSVVQLSEADVNTLRSILFSTDCVVYMCVTILWFPVDLDTGCA